MVLGIRGWRQVGLGLCKVGGVFVVHRFVQCSVGVQGEMRSDKSLPTGNRMVG